MIRITVVLLLAIIFMPAAFAQSGITGGGGSVSLTATSPIVITPSPTTGTGVISCPTCGTSSGTVTSFSAGALSPLFTTSVATATTTPALTFLLTNAAANTVFANPTGSSGAPIFTTTPSMGSFTTVTGGWTGTEVSASAGSAGFDTLWSDSTAHRWQMTNNGGSADSVVGQNTTDTLANKTLTTPTIASFANATHNHQNAAGGGTLANAVLQNSATTVNSQTCTLGASCTIPLSAVNPQTATYQVLAADFSSYKTITVASGTFTITLVASGSQPTAGQYLNIINYGSGVVTVARSGQNINGAAGNFNLNAGSATAPTSTTIISDGTNYFATVDEGTVGTVTGSSLTSNAVIIGAGGSAVSAISADTTTTHALFATAGAPAFRALATTDEPSAVVQTGQANTAATAMTLDMSGATGANAFRVPAGAGLTSGADGAIAYDTTAKNTHIRINAGDGLAVAEASAIGANTIPKSNNASVASITGSSLSDNGSLVASTEPWKFGTAGGNPHQDLTFGSTTSAMGAQSSATCTNITGMTWTINASKNYSLRCMIPVTFAATATIAFCLNGPGTPTSYTLDDFSAAAALPDPGPVVNNSTWGTKTTASAAPGAVSEVLYVNAFIQNGATASGTALTLQTAANGTNNITVGANAVCDLKQVN